MTRAHKIVSKVVGEAAYPGNIGFDELVKFYKVASTPQQEEMKKVLKKGDWLAFKDLVGKVVNVKLRG